MATQPTRRPSCANFGSGPCTKRPGWSFDALSASALGRSHRSALGKAKLKACCDETKQILGLPDGYLVGVVPASDTGAVEMVMWSMLGARPVDICYWETFGKTWYDDAVNQLTLEGVREFSAPFGSLPDLSGTDPSHDIVFTYNGTTGGAKVPNLDWIADDRQGLTICDATSAIFGMDMGPWHKMDVITYSWQKVLGGEGGHGMLILGPRAVQRLESYEPPRALPKIFRMAKAGKLIHGIFQGETINTPSMMCVEDYLDALDWARNVGGLSALIAKSQANFDVIAHLVEEEPWIDFLCTVPEHRSNTSVCLVLKAADGSPMAQASVDALRKILEKEGVAYDIGSYRDAPPGLRIWCGATVEADDLRILCDWLKWAHKQI